MDRKKIGVLIFNDIEVLDFCGPFEVFSVTRLNEERRYEEPSPFEVLLIAQSAQAITTTGGMQVLPHVTFDNCPPLDVLIIPGGLGVRNERNEMNNEAVLSFVKAQRRQVEILASVCTGSLILGNAGILNKLRATTHWRSLDVMQQLFPQVKVDKRSHVVEDGNIFTSAGISAGIDMALMIVVRYCGEPVARATARHMEYPFPESNARRVMV